MAKQGRNVAVMTEQVSDNASKHEDMRVALVANGTAQLTPSVAVMSLGVPLVTVLNANGARGYCRRSVDVTMTQTEAETLRDLCDGLRSAGIIADKPNPTEADAIRWMLRQLEKARVQTAAA